MAQCVVCLQRNNPFPLPGMAMQPRTVLNEAGGVSHFFVRKRTLGNKEPCSPLGGRPCSSVHTCPSQPRPRCPRLKRGAA